MAVNESISGMITKTTQMLYDNLKTRYDSGFPILKELIQNANDAKASVLKVTKIDGLKEAKHPLLQKPALIVFNNGEVKVPDDLEGIESFGEVAKLGRSGVIGKFGLGMKSIFHFCDMFFYIAYQKKDKEIVHAVNPYFDYIKQEDKFHKEWNQFEKTDQELLVKSVKDIVQNYDDGLLLWIPLRDGSYKHTITKDIYDINDIWKLSNKELEENIALSLASLDISIPCSEGKRTLEKIEISTQKPIISLELKKDANKIFSGKEVFCEITKTEPMGNVEGEGLLKNLISKDKFAKVSYMDENGDEVETCSYKENQKVALAIVKINNKKDSFIKINWSSYLPLNGEDDSEFYVPNLNCEYHVLAHANFAIDSGRRNIIKYNECIDKNIKIDPNFENVDDKSAQVEWNKILIRYFILPELLHFASEKGDKAFFEGLYYSLAETYNKNLGYFCFDKGIVFKNGTKWEYQKTKSIEESGLYLINRTAEKYSAVHAFADDECFKSTIKICNYIQSETPSMSWSISVAEKTLNYDDLAQINTIISEKHYPILLLPYLLSKEILNNSYRLENAEVAINFLEEFETILEDKASDIFESLCSNDSITKEVSKAIFTNERIKRYVKLFKVTSLDPEETKYNAEGKTFNEICKLSDNSQLFFYVAQNDSKQERELQPIYLLQRMCPNITFYCAGRATAKNQLFLKEDEKDSIYKYITEVDELNPTNEPQIKLLDSIKVSAILYAMKQNLHSLEFGSVSVADEFLSSKEIKHLSEQEKKDYFHVLRSILLGKPTEDNLMIYKLVSSLGREERAQFFYSIICKYSTTEYQEHIIRTGFDYPQSLIEALRIHELTDDDLEKRLGSLVFDVKKATEEEKELLSKLIYNKEVFSKLEIHKTVTGEFVSLENSTYNCFLEAEDENIRFPSSYIFPDKFKLIKRNNDIPCQSYIEKLTYDVLIKTILLDENNGLGTPEAIKLSGFVCSILEKGKGKITSEGLVPNARKRKWIPDYAFHFYALDEVIDCLTINENLISLCSGLIHASKINESYHACRDYFVKDKSEALKQLLSHPDNNSETKWPWFNFLLFPVLKNDEVAKELLPYILMAEDSSIQILNDILKENPDEIIEKLRSLPQELYVRDPVYISQRYKEYVIKLGSKFETGSPISDDMLSIFEIIFENITEEDILDLISQAKKEKETHTIKLPSEGKTWSPVVELANFKTTIPDLKAENTLSRRIYKKFPAVNRREGTQDNGTEIQLKELIEKLDSCKNPKLWGAFCYLVLDENSKILLASHGRLIEKNTIDILKGYRLPKTNKSTIVVYGTEDNYCKSITGELIKLKDAKEMDTVFYNNPEFADGIIKVEMFDNFSAFSATSIENAIRTLFSIFTSVVPCESFFNDLANPSQTHFNIAVNMIFATVFDTLKRLKLDIRAGENNLIALEYKNYMRACGICDSDAMRASWDNIRRLIEINSGKIQNQIRDGVVNFIREAEYQERCILFELFQNGDDAYVQKGYDSEVNYFNVSTTKDMMSVEHCGRPINEYKSGGLPEYEYDLSNMLIIGWSDKANMHGKQTGKFGYGFKTVYLISDEPHVVSGVYDFVVKAALYPQQVGDGYTEKTIISLPLNENGLKKKTEIVSEFEKSAKYLVIFSKKIKEIRTDDNVYSWKANKSLELSQFIIETDGDILLFKTIPAKIQDKQCQFASFAFKINGNSVVPMDEKTPKMWCLAPLSDFSGLNFAINAEFKTNTGRQTLACENPDNKRLINNVSKMFIDALFEIKDNEFFGCYFNSIINIILDSKTKSKGFLANFSDYAVQLCLANGIIPNGTTEVFNYKNQNIYALSAHPFGSHVTLQYKYINAMNEFIRDCDESNYIVTTQILADLMPEGHNSSIVEMKSIITILDCLLNLNSNNVQRQKEILLKFKDSSLYDFVKEKGEELSACKIKDADGSLKFIKKVVEVSPEYGEAASILGGLYSPEKDAMKSHYQNHNQETEDEQNDESDGEEYPSYILNDIPSVMEVYNRWAALSNEEWNEKKHNYYSWMFPKQLSRNNLKESLVVNEDYWLNYDEENPTIPKSWCVLFLLGILQSSVYYNHSDVSRRLRIEQIDELITMFCDGANLQEIYDKFLETTQFAEEDLEEFERLLRVYKFRKNFMSFYYLFKGQTKGDIKSTGQILIPASDSELSGSGIEAFASDRSLKFGISLIMRELQECDFYDDKEKAFETLNQFTYIPNKKLRRIVYQVPDPIGSTSEALYKEIKKQLENVPRLNEFLAEHDLPFIILGE